ncbi:polyprenol phosphomannose-dependent alpha 1,6 mannosyltransferase MptB [Actinoplanes sp. NPDC048967]|uniref:polyprenol phosphomannose-dependent alpha 1,6 mannosyltransferase MptB n=1 Tax=Actinoplanes sp. NPDC048967 TaxID=3155269 RepID=UPI0033F1DE5D
MRLIRWGGLAGSVLVAAAAYLGGSPFARGTTVTPGTMLAGREGLLLPLCWVLGLAALLCAWWFGRHRVPSTRWALVTAGLWILPVLPMLPLGSEDIYSYACQGFVQHSGGDPYAGGVQDFGCPWLGSVSTTWRTSPAPYGPLFLLVAGWAVALGDSLPGVIAGLRVIALAGLGLVAAGLPVLARRAGIDPARAVWTVLACPLVLIHLVSGAHNDALMVGLLVVGLALVAARPSPSLLVAAGVALGLAVAVKATAVVVLPFAVLAAVPPSAPVRTLWRPAALIAAGAVGTVGLVSLVSGRGPGWIAGLLRSGDTVAWTSPSTAVGLTVQAVTGVDAVGVTRILGVLLLVVLLPVLWWRARDGGALPGAGWALGLTVLCAPVFHPWYAIWPLAVLAATTVERRWVLGLCALAATLTLPAGYNWALFTRVPGAPAVTAVLVVLAVRQARELRHRRVSA